MSGSLTRPVPWRRGAREPRRAHAAVIDDEPVVRGLASTILEGRGWQVSAFADASAALEALCVNGRRVDVVVCDLRLPDLHGDRLCEALRLSLGDFAPPVVIMSGADEEDDIGRALDAGALHFLKKPFSPGELLALVERAVRPGAPGAPGETPRRLGPYLVLEELGRGGFGVVHRAVRAGTGEEVALKVLPADRATVEDQLRFRRELDTLANLDHPCIARGLDAGADGGRVWFAMELVRGRTLEALLRDEGPLPWRRASALGALLADALAYLHGRGLVHRDVKPANVMVLADGRPRLVDFGLARRPTDLALTRASVTLGTLPYMAPELARGARPAPAQDLFALGLVLHEAIGGAPPVDHARFASAPLDALLSYERGALPPLAVPGLPDAVRDVVARLVLPDPSARPAASEVADTLAGLLVEERS